VIDEGVGSDVHARVIQRRAAAREEHRQDTIILLPTRASITEIAERTTLSGACVLANEPINVNTSVGRLPQNISARIYLSMVPFLP
jgi:hypothetical protein